MPSVKGKRRRHEKRADSQEKQFELLSLMHFLENC